MYKHLLHQTRKSSCLTGRDYHFLNKNIFFPVWGCRRYLFSRPRGTPSPVLGREGEGISAVLSRGYPLPCLDGGGSTTWTETVRVFRTGNTLPSLWTHTHRSKHYLPASFGMRALTINFSINFNTSVFIGSDDVMTELDTIEIYFYELNLTHGSRIYDKNVYDDPGVSAMESFKSPGIVTIKTPYAAGIQN